jgi:hypothetical protein
MPLHPPKAITTIRTLHIKAARRNGMLTHDSTPSSTTAKNDFSGKFPGNHPLTPYEITWAGTNNGTEAESTESTLLGEPSPVDWEQW